MNITRNKEWEHIRVLLVDLLVVYGVDESDAGDMCEDIGSDLESIVAEHGEGS
jgi:hypothetical protein